MNRYQSWGRVPPSQPARVHRVHWRSELSELDLGAGPVLPFGLGRSYGDSCLNDGGVLIDTSGLNRILAFDRERGSIRCEAGVSLDDLLELIVPSGWFLPVTPGTRFVTVAGAVANDIHGKNHHRAGTFGCHLRRFELIRSDGTRRECAPDENGGLFRATIGGLGLTGLVSWLEFQLTPIPSAYLDVEQFRFRSFDEYLALESESSEGFDYTVSWIDCITPGPGRGLFQRANFAEASPRDAKPSRFQLTAPFDLPSFLANKWTMRLVNEAIYRSQLRDRVSRRVHYQPFFYPLDMILEWRRLYGKAGFFQHQFVVPTRADGVFREMLARISASGEGSSLVVLKKFGAIESPGLLSFPREGLTLALDFPNRGDTTRRLLDDLDRLVLDAGGAVYPAKDARMSAESFQSFFPRWKEFERYVDPAFSSSFWRRVTSEVGR